MHRHMHFIVSFALHPFNNTYFVQHLINNTVRSTRHRALVLKHDEDICGL